MKIRELSKLASKKIANGLELIELVAEEDGVGFTQYELHIQGKDGIFNMNATHNHLYYIIEGSCKVHLAKGSSYNLAQDSAIAVPKDMNGTITGKEDQRTRIIIFYVQPDPKFAVSEPIVRTLEEIIGGPRDIDWSRGHSRRFFSQPDGFGISIHNTFADPGQKSPLEYKNNFESNYLYKGNTRYIWNEGEDSIQFTQESVEDGNALMVLLDDHDKHWVQTFEKTGYCLCAFYPALQGNEKHDFDKKDHSSF